MRIAIPVEENQKEICPSFGRAPLFYLYDTETKEGIYVENAAINAPGGAGIKAAQVILDVKADVVLVPRCGENAAKVLEAGGVRLYESVGVSVAENLQAYFDGKLTVLTDIHPGFHGHGGN